MPGARNNADVVREMWDAFGREGLIGLLPYHAPDAVWEPWTAQGRRFGSTGDYRSYIEQEMGPRQEVVEASLSEIQEVEPFVVVSGRVRLRTADGLRDTGMHWVHRFDDEGRIVFTASYPDVGKALQAAGVRTDR